MTAKGYSMGDRLGRAHLVIRNAMNDETIMNAVAQYNYNLETMKKGEQLYQTTVELESRKAKILGEKLAATFRLNQKKQALKKKYRDHLQLARITLARDAPAAQMLGLNGQRKRRFAAFLEEVRQFYTNAAAEPKIIEALARFAITKEHLEEGKAMVEDLELAAAEQEKRKGLLQQAVNERNEARKKMERWVRDFLKVCRIALGRDSQLLEKLGIVVP